MLKNTFKELDKQILTQSKYIIIDVEIGLINKLGNFFALRLTVASLHFS